MCGCCFLNRQEGISYQEEKVVMIGCLSWLAGCWLLAGSRAGTIVWFIWSIHFYLKICNDILWIAFFFAFFLCCCCLFLRNINAVFSKTKAQHCCLNTWNRPSHAVPCRAKPRPDQTRPNQTRPGLDYIRLLGYTSTNSCIYCQFPKHFLL